MCIKKKYGLLLIVVLCIIVYVSFIIISNTERIPNEEYEVISTVLYRIHNPYGFDKIFIKQITSNGGIGDISFNGFENYTKAQLDVSLVDDFKKKNSKTYKFENRFSIPYPIPKNVFLISENELDDIIRDDKGWDEFHEKNPRSPGIIETSRVGFNSNHTQAILYFGSQFYPQDISGYLYLLTKDNGNWTIKENFWVWGNGSDIFTHTNNFTVNGSETIPNEEYEVFSAVLLPFPQSAKLAIGQETSNYWVKDRSISDFENYTKVKLDAALIDDFKKSNEKTYKLENNFSIPQIVFLISEKDFIDKYDTYYVRFYMKYPNSPGIIGISRVGFNNNHTQAILYLGNRYDYLAGGGFLIFLNKEEGKWIVKDSARLWIS